MKLMLLLLASFAAVGCDNSAPAPKPTTWKATVTPEQARQILDRAETKQRCSEQKLKTATEAQRVSCDPTRGMFEGIRAAGTRATTPARPAKQ